MSDMISWIQSNWYELGNLAVQFAMLAVVVSYGRKALRILALPLTTSRAASQAQVELLEDLQKLAEPRGSGPHAEPEAAAHSRAGRMVSPIPEAPEGSHAEPAVLSHNEGISSWRALVTWLQAPMENRPGPAWRRVSRPVVSAEPEAVAYGGVGRMLSPMPEAPAGNQAEPAMLSHNKGISPWRALVAWLQAPMGNRPGPAWRRVSRQVS